jgi:uncharacterized protein (DUF433 family)
MTLVISDMKVPLRVDEQGAVRVGKTRVTLDTLISAFKGGAAPETIVRQFDTLQLPDVYAAIAYYLTHRDEVEAYLAEGEKLGEEIRRQWESRWPQQGLRERLLARRAAKEAESAAVSRG